MFYIKNVNSTLIQTEISPHQPFPQSFCSVVGADGCCVSAQQQAYVQCMHKASPAVHISPHPLIQCVRERTCTCTYAFQWGTWQGSMERRGRLKWRLLCKDHHDLAPRPPLSPPHRLRGARADIRLEVVTSAPHPTVQKLQLAVSSSVRVDALNASTFVII